MCTLKSYFRASIDGRELELERVTPTVKWMEWMKYQVFDGDLVTMDDQL
jgi:hypothetical protein